MRCTYEGSVSIPHSEYENFRKILEEIQPQRRQAKFRGTLFDCWGARATILYDAASNDFYERASKRKVYDSTQLKGRVAITELGRASMSGDEDVLHATMHRLQAQNRSGKHRSRHKTMRLPQKHAGCAY